MQMIVALFWYLLMRIAIITPCILPVPATKGGAVEELITRIIGDNEKSKKLNIDLYSIPDTQTYYGSYENTNIILVDNKMSGSITEKLRDKYYRTVPGSNARRAIDKVILDKFISRTDELSDSYDAVIVENMMSVAVMLVNYFKGSLAFPIYFHMHNNVDIYRSPSDIRYLVDKGIQFIAVSNYIAGRIKMYAADATVHILYNGVDLNDFKKTVRDNSDVFRFLYAGRVIGDKGAKELVLAFIKLLNTSCKGNKKYSLDIIGFSNKHTKYERLILRMIEPYSDSISCQKQLSTSYMKKKYSEYDAVVIPSVVEEAFGMVALEAMAQGIPLIVTDSGALPEVVQNGAMIVRGGESIVDNLCFAMEKIATDQNVRDIFRENAYDRAYSVSGFDINNYYDNLLKIIDRDNDLSKISVIVPVYNVKDYLNRCVDSLLEQTYFNLEIILIDDGSTDGSGDICDKYAEKDARIKVVHQQNMGLSKARNIGVEKAAGEYIFFCDSDDYLEKGALENLYNKLSRDNADIVACGINCIVDGSEAGNNNTINTSDKYGIWSGKQSVIQMMRSSNICSIACNKLYKKSLFEGITFPEGVFHEDEATVYKLLYKAGIVSYTPVRYYNYCLREHSIMNFDLIRRYNDSIKAVQERIDFFDKKDSELAQYSRITLLELIKYAYRNLEDESARKSLAELYAKSINLQTAPSVMGIKKKTVLLFWKYYKY